MHSALHPRELNIGSGLTRDTFQHLAQTIQYQACIRPLSCVERRLHSPKSVGAQQVNCGQNTGLLLIFLVLVFDGFIDRFDYISAVRSVPSHCSRKKRTIYVHRCLQRGDVGQYT
jgi:hypothetical protein